MSNFTIEIIELSTHFIEIETSFVDTVTDNIEIERFDAFNLEIVNTEKILWSDLPDNIPMSKISGNLSASRIDNLEDYVRGFLTETATIHVDNLIWGENNIGLSGYLNQYSFDCGSPLDISYIS